MADHGLLQRRAARLVGVDPKTIRRERIPDIPEIRVKMRDLATKRRRFGYRRSISWLKRIMGIFFGFSRGRFRYLFLTLRS